MCSDGADFADVREGSPVSKSLVALRIRSLANGGEHAAGDWGSRGRRFKSCHPDGKQQVRGRFGQNPRRPLCCRVAIGVVTAHILTRPLLLRAAGRQRAHPPGRVAVHAAVTATKECPSSSETVCSGTPAASMRVACLNVCRPTSLMPKALAATLIARSPFLGWTAVPLSVVNTMPASTQIEAALSRSTAWLALTNRNRATVAGDRGTSRRERSVLGSLMTRCPLTRETVPRTRRRPLVGSTSDQRRASASPRDVPLPTSRRSTGA